MEKAKFTIKPLLFIGLLIVGIIICYFTGSLAVDTTNSGLGFKIVTVFLGGLLWVLIAFIIVILMKGYEEFKEFLN